MQLGHILIALCLFIVSTSMATTPEPNKLRVLIVDGFSNHDWEATTEDIKGMLDHTPMVSYEVSTVPTEDSAEWTDWLPNFSRYDVVIQNTTDIQVGGSWPRAAQVQLEAFVFNGGGLYIYHSANNAFPEWKEYNRMIGLGWRSKEFGPAIEIVNGEPVLIPAGEGENTGHGARQDTIITRINDHPIHQNLPQQWLAADLEVYRYARGPAENLTVISYAYESKTQMNFPIEWVVQYGQGRVYNSTYGHHWHTQQETPAGIRCIAFQTLFKRAIHWLAHHRIDSSVPQQFPKTISPSQPQ